MNRNKLFQTLLSEKAAESRRPPHV